MKINNTNELNLKPKKQYNILALSGGGFRGLYTAEVLVQLEKSLGKPIAKHFDLICGTSVGGLIALALAAEIPTEKIKDLFISEGEQIFHKKKSRKYAEIVLKKISPILLLPFCHASYRNAGLKNAIVKLFEESKINTLGDLTHPVIIPAINYTTGKLQLFKTPHHKNFQKDNFLPIVDIALSTSAAPTYFPIHKTSSGTFVDGGLVANSPGFFGYHEIRTFFEEGADANINLLSIGTMSSGSTIDSSMSLNRGVLNWGNDLINLMISSQESSTDYLLQQLLKDNYLRIDEVIPHQQLKTIKNLDSVSSEAKDLLIQHGYESAKKNIGKKIDKFKNHLASQPVFHHGPNKNTK